MRHWRSLAAAATMIAALSASAQAETFINILTGGTSGVYYPLGVALSQIYADNIEGARPSVQATKASVENLNLLQAGQGRDRLHARRQPGARRCRQCRSGFRRAARQAADRRRDLSELRAGGREPGIRHQDARRPEGQAPVRRRAGIRHRAQCARDPRRRRHELRGPRPGRIPALRRIGGADEEPAARRHAAVGGARRRLDPRPCDRCADRRRGGSGRCRREGRRRPTWLPRSPPAPTRGRTRTCRRRPCSNYLVTHADVPDDVVYAMTKALFEHLDDMAAAHAAAKAIKLERCRQGPAGSAASRRGALLQGSGRDVAGAIRAGSGRLPPSPRPLGRGLGVCRLRLTPCLHAISRQGGEG